MPQRWGIFVLRASSSGQAQRHIINAKQSRLVSIGLNGQPLKVPAIVVHFSFYLQQFQVFPYPPASGSCWPKGEIGFRFWANALQALKWQKYGKVIEIEIFT